MGKMSGYYVEFDEFDEYKEDEPKKIICKLCGRNNLYWYESKTDGRWFLVENNKAHQCNPLAAYRKKFG